MKYKRMVSLALALCLMLSLGTAALAAETKTASVPVTLTVVNNVQRLSVTCLGCLPVAVADSQVVTATNAKITNTAASGSVRVTAVEVKAGDFSIGSYENFKAEANTLALSVNGCGTEGAGKLAITQTAFPVIAAGKSLSLSYEAKVSTTQENLSGVTAAYLIFTISAA